MGSGLAESGEKSTSYGHIGVVGAGSWGTALALVAAEAGRRVTLWAREAEVVASISSSRENARFLPGTTLPATITPTGDIAEAASADAVLVAVPAQHLRETLSALKPRKPTVLCAKGIERGTGKLLTEVLSECAPQAEPAILSGPSFARDVAQHLPTAITIAARMDIATALQSALGHGTFRPYASDDLIGVALGGAAKNVYAIGCGIVAGLGLGESARAALLARSFAELCRLGEAIGARSETLMGLSGLGDLVLTATSPTSRNFSYGVATGKGQPHTAALAEGVDTAPALVSRAKRHNVELPIAEAIADILAGTLALQDAIPRLMSRPLKTE